jgi:4,5-DOPA dioxygenase extradiol
MPVLFLSHGAPPLVDDATWVSELEAWSDGLPTPSAILGLAKRSLELA